MSTVESLDDVVLIGAASVVVRLIVLSRRRFHWFAFFPFSVGGFERASMIACSCICFYGV